MGRKSRREFLQEVADELRLDDQYEFWIEFRGAAGWWAVASEARWFGDQGEYLGRDWRQAELTLGLILG